MEVILRQTMFQKRARLMNGRTLILLAMNTEGYHNLLILSSRGFLDGFYYRPRIDLELLAKHHRGLIALSGDITGEVPQAIYTYDEKRATDVLQKYLRIFESDRFYLEVQPKPSVPHQSEVNDMLLRIGRACGVPVVATNDIHYILSEDAEAQDILTCIGSKKLLDDSNRYTLVNDDYSFWSEEQMRQAFLDHPEVVDETVRLAERCNVEIELGKIQLPHFNVPNQKTAEEYLERLCYYGLSIRYTNPDATSVFNPPSFDELPATPPPNIAPKILDRLTYELSVIEKTGYASYFLIVQDFVNWAKQNSIMVGPGRGSAAGSIVAYLTNITNIDPLTYDLLFERFLNPERISMPDIDMDFADDRRDDVIHYVEKKYGKDHVAQIITFGTMAARAAVRDVGRVMGLPYTYCDRVAKLIPMFTDLDEALKTVPELKELNAHDEQGRALLNSAHRLEGVARHASTHACGVLITKQALMEHVPLQYASQNDQTLISQYSLHPVEDLGLLKMDFLGLTNLTILENAIAIIKKTTGEEIDIDHVPLDDRKAFRLLQKGETMGIFQLESSGMRRYLKELNQQNWMILLLWLHCIALDPWS